MPNDFPDFSEVGEDFRSGFVAILGEPNVGKSTLLNALLDFKLAIVSSKPQTTRDRITGVYTDEACQIVFVDTPGVMEPHDRFNECLRDSALEALDGADIVFHLVEAGGPRPLPTVAAEALGRLRKPLFLVANKIDRFGLKAGAAPVGDADASAMLGEEFRTEIYEKFFLISALERQGLTALLDATRERLPLGSLLYDPDFLTDRSLRFLASEIVREKVLSNLEEEVPYAIATQTEEFVEREDGKHYVRVVIYVEQESQKSIVIGKGGAMLRKIGSEARPEIETQADHPVFLELWVKVRKNWRKKENDLREFGYQSKRPKKKR